MVGMLAPKWCQQASESLYYLSYIPLFAPFLDKLPKPLEARWLPTSPILHPPSAKSRVKEFPFTYLQHTLNKRSNLEQKFWLFSYWPKLGHIPKPKPSFWPGYWVPSLDWVTCSLWKQRWSQHHPNPHRMNSWNETISQKKMKLPFLEKGEMFSKWQTKKPRNTTDVNSKNFD